MEQLGSVFGSQVLHLEFVKVTGPQFLEHEGHRLAIVHHLHRLHRHRLLVRLRSAVA